VEFRNVQQVPRRDTQVFIWTRLMMHVQDEVGWPILQPLDKRRQRFAQKTARQVHDARRLADDRGDQPYCPGEIERARQST
jgi:hypothetical protein